MPSLLTLTQLVFPRLTQHSGAIFVSCWREKSACPDTFIEQIAARFNNTLTRKFTKNPNNDIITYYK